MDIAVESVGGGALLLVFKYEQHKSFGNAMGRKIGTSATWSTKK